MPQAAESETVEITKQDLATLQRSYKVLNGLMLDPKQGLPFKRMLKAFDPSIPVPDVELADTIAAPIQAELDELKKSNAALLARLDKREKDDGDRDTLTDVYAKIDKVVKDHGLTDEGREGMIKVMHDRQIADPEAAALVYLNGLPKPKPQTGGQQYLPQTMNLFGVNTPRGENELVDAFFDDPMKAQDAVITDILNESMAA